jgi:argininosuccinate synthase
MVDLLCLGVKDTLFSFNSPLFEYKVFVEEKMEHLEMVTVDYTLAHNVVYAAVEFAEKYGFKPHKDFIATTRYHLKEDNEEVELIDIKCGKNGKPVYVQGPFDDSQKVKQIIAQLDRTAGPGNYDYILAGDEEWNEEQDDDEDNWDNDEDK